MRCLEALVGQAADYQLERGRNPSPNALHVEGPHGASLEKAKAIHVLWPRCIFRGGDRLAPTRSRIRCQCLAPGSSRKDNDLVPWQRADGLPLGLPLAPQKAKWVSPL